MSYSDLLRDPRWQKMRLEVMARDSFTCRLCGDSESTLNVHHLHYDRGSAPWEYPHSALVTVCGECHDELHAEKFGESIIEAMISGGADIKVLREFRSLFQDMNWKDVDFGISFKPKSGADS